MNKDVLLIACAFVTAVSIAVAVITFEKQHKLSKTLEEERYSRIVAEESSQKSAAKVTAIENQLRTATEKVAKLKDVLDQEKGVNEDLKNQYEQLVQAKTALEEKLRSAVEEKPVPLQPEQENTVVNTTVEESK